MVVKSHVNDNNHATDKSVAEITCEPTDLSALSATPLARQHQAQKHYRSSDMLPHHARTQANETPVKIENQPASLAVEAAVAIVINGIHYAVLMASPHQLEYLALGFLYSEGLIQHGHDLLDWEVTQLTDDASYQLFTKTADTDDADLNTLNESITQLRDYDIYVVDLVLNQRCHQHIQAQKRQLAGRTGCGMCGITGLTQALPNLSIYRQDAERVKSNMPELDYLLEMRRQVDIMQHTHQLTGAVHAAATMQGEELHLFEDVGRHNALDKLIGWQLRHKTHSNSVLMTSRLSIELVQKSIRGHIPWLIGMSAPTSTAVRIADRYNLGLAGFLRANRVTYYSGT
ncbi:formate dehydrogenase accessory sulfurtransferase FdhD [Psychrobacter sp.]|uniref:formate dehydrogenase accessory sulfurtransferase FdhD n=1 Tax=Psychrobacter sp. TaxID=56811 RepID=UPI0026473012|nr:formate dehydrogenase accessory sulfurtransferase FdhD [Psychrobacter sp.]MDN6275342.1 formate dehydrogenase accessory sulfurtransferase FdhD [Psychrobacter sp.]MDN6307260.1 formate dehydrogenase accessory sulfurtransferase FdhD [Psychrobacter sp.]